MKAIATGVVFGEPLKSKLGSVHIFCKILLLTRNIINSKNKIQSRNKRISSIEPYQLDGHVLTRTYEKSYPSGFPFGPKKEWILSNQGIPASGGYPRFLPGAAKPICQEKQFLWFKLVEEKAFHTLFGNCFEILGTPDKIITMPLLSTKNPAYKPAKRYT